MTQPPKLLSLPVFIPLVMLGLMALLGGRLMAHRAAVQNDRVRVTPSAGNPLSSLTAVKLPFLNQPRIPGSGVG